MLSSGSGVAPASRWIGSLPGTASASTRRPDARPSRSASSSSLPSRSARHVSWAGKPIERSIQYVAVRESTANAIGRVDHERMRFAQGQEAQAMIQIAVRQQDRGDRRVTGPARMKRRVALDLLADLRRAIQQEPSIAIGADGHGFLGPRGYPRVACAYAAAVGANTVPLPE